MALLQGPAHAVLSEGSDSAWDTHMVSSEDSSGWITFCIFHQNNAFQRNRVRDHMCVDSDWKMGSPASESGSCPCDFVSRGHLAICGDISGWYNLGWRQGALAMLLSTLWCRGRPNHKEVLGPRHQDLRPEDATNCLSRTCGNPRVKDISFSSLIPQPCRTHCR